MFISEITLWSVLITFLGHGWSAIISLNLLAQAGQDPLISNQFTWDQKYQCIMSFVRGLVYLHTYKVPIIHRNLKSRNVLLDSTKGTKLTDFGTSHTAEAGDTMATGIGSYQWMAPEFCTYQVSYANLRHPQSGGPLSQFYVFREVGEVNLHLTFDGVIEPVWVKDVTMQCLQLNELDRSSTLEIFTMLNK
ncbi:hypothetical protein THRCLA_09282, partial [Thraustotheca clavata]